MSTSAWLPANEEELKKQWQPVSQDQLAALKNQNIRNNAQFPNPDNPTLLDHVISGTKEGVKGVLKGGVNSLQNIGHLLLGTENPNSPTRDQTMTTPQNQAQRIGYNGEQAAEWLLPTGLEEKAGVMASKLPGVIGRIAKPTAKLATAAAETGVRNMTQGGDFTTGAAGGAIGSGATQALKAVAPKIADVALGFRRSDRLRGKVPGRAVLDETTGLNPATIAARGKDKAAQLTSDLNLSASQSQAPASVDRAIGILNQEGQNASGSLSGQNDELLVSKINKMKNRLTMDPNGQPFPNPTTPEHVLQLKRGTDNLISSWNQQEHTNDVPRIAKRVYGALDDEVDRTVPGADVLNDRISSLIPVVKRAEEKAASAGTIGRIVGRVAAHTGALTAGAYGFQHYGLPGAVAGVVLPEVAVSPTLQMGIARAANSPIVGKYAVPAAKGAALQLDRPLDRRLKFGEDQ